uniref:Small ribosomal subunit protein eS1 n=1 Tax=Oryctolagus cuniculus TaxID=9986 RepID=G1TKM8_RABIT
MAVGKNKRLTKGGKKGAKKKVVDPFSKKDSYDVKAPAMFNIRNIGKTLVMRTQGTNIASDGLKGRVFEVSLADLQNDEVAFRKFKLITEDVQGKNCLTNSHGMDLTRDKMCSMVKKWQTMIEAHVDVKTTDGYLLRLFCVGFTKKCNNQIRKTSYAQHQQVRQIRKKMMEIMTREVQTNDLKEVVNKLIPDSIGKDIEKACQSIYPLHDVFVRKVKMLKKHKFELGKLMELHGEGSSSGKATGDETGAKDFGKHTRHKSERAEGRIQTTALLKIPGLATSRRLWGQMHFSSATPTGGILTLQSRRAQPSRSNPPLAASSAALLRPSQPLPSPGSNTLDLHTHWSQLGVHPVPPREGSLSAEPVRPRLSTPTWRRLLRTLRDGQTTLLSFQRAAAIPHARQKTSPFPKHWVSLCQDSRNSLSS